MAAPQQGGQSDNAGGVLWITAACLAAAAGIWYAFKSKIVYAYFTLKVWEIDFLSLFTHKLDDVKTVISSADPKLLNFHDVIAVGQAVGSYLRFPFIIIIFILAFVVFLNHGTRVFKRTYSMRDLADLEKVNWPQITPVVNLDLIKTDIDKGPWAMAMTPMQFCKHHKLLVEHRRQPQEGMTRKEMSQIEVTLKRGPTTRIFALQLGSLWQGTDKLPLHARALFAVFAARYASDSKAALNLLRQIAVSSSGKLDFSGTDELCKKHEGNKGIQKIMSSHAYVLTVMAAMLQAAREDGVQASADFLWLKPIDRRLWYMLNTVGRQTPFVEVAGPFAHWVAEKEIGKSLLVPMVEEATNALERALKDILYKPDEE